MINPAWRYARETLAATTIASESRIRHLAVSSGLVVNALIRVSHVCLMAYRNSFTIVKMPGQP
jgi:hypothetical protein